MENEQVGDLGRVALFAGLSDEAISAIATKCRWLRFQPDEQVFDKESDTLDVYFVVEGAVRILVYSANEREVTLATFSAGEYFGELAAIDRKPRSARVVATESALLASLPGPAFIECMTQYPSLALRVLERFARIIRGLDTRVTELSTLSEAERIYAELIRIAKSDPKRPGGFFIPEMPKHNEIAGWTGTSRETVAQTIGELQRDGIVERRHLGLVIRDWGRLQLMARVGRT